MILPSHPGPFVKSEESPWRDSLKLGMKRSFRANVALLHPEEACRFLYFVEEGEILTTHFASPTDGHTVNIIGKNAVAGLFEMFAPFSPKASWRTLSPTVCHLFSRECVQNDLPRPLLIALLEQSAFMGVSLADSRSRGKNKRNDIRLARFLLHLAESRRPATETENGAVTILPGVTQEASSELLGIHLVTFNKILRAFRDKGFIGKSKKSGLQILDIRALARYAEGDMPPLL